MYRRTQPASIALLCLLQSLLRLLRNGRKSRRFPDREIRQDLAVQLDPGALHAIDELRIGQSVLARTGIDALDPQAAEVALLGAPVAVGVLQALFDLLEGNTVVVVGPADIALGHVEDLLVPRMRGNAAFGTCHDLVSVALGKFRGRWGGRNESPSSRHPRTSLRRDGSAASSASAG